MMRGPIIIAVMLISELATAAEMATPADLPATLVARQVLDADARVANARAALNAARIEGEITALGPHEFQVRATRQQRKISNGPGYAEWSAALERPIRWPGKAALDQKLGELTVAEAEARYGDALHQASRDLLNLWMDSVGAIHANEIIAAQRGSAQENLAAVEKRFRAGDAAQLDVNLAQAELAELARASSEHATQAAAARARLQGRFPVIAPERLQLSEPQALSGDITFWQQAIVLHSHELRIPEAQLARAQAAAERARAERTPDPTVGAYFASEVGGDEKIIGASVSIPLPSRRRMLQTDQALAAVAAARFELNAQRRSLETEIAANVNVARGSYETWVAANQAAGASNENVRLIQRAYQLGESDLQAVLQARRLALAAALTAHQARVAALRAYYLLLVDAHMIWDMEASDH